MSDAGILFPVLLLYVVLERKKKENAGYYWMDDGWPLEDFQASMFRFRALFFFFLFSTPRRHF